MRITLPGAGPGLVPGVRFSASAGWLEVMVSSRFWGALLRSIAGPGPCSGAGLMGAVTAGHVVVLTAVIWPVRVCFGPGLLAGVGGGGRELAGCLVLLCTWRRIAWFSWGWMITPAGDVAGIVPAGAWRAGLGRVGMVRDGEHVAGIIWLARGAAGWPAGPGWLVCWAAGARWPGRGEGRGGGGFAGSVFEGVAGQLRLGAGRWLAGLVLAVGWVRLWWSRGRRAGYGALLAVGLPARLARWRVLRLSRAGPWTGAFLVCWRRVCARARACLACRRIFAAGEGGFPGWWEPVPAPGARGSAAVGRKPALHDQ
jgi:hypothetical protein